jgi:hypothetical protein
MRPISRCSLRAATTLAISLATPGCGARRPIAATTTEPALTKPRVLPLPRALILETSGSPPSDTSVSFVAGAPRSIVLRHGPPENIVFARLSFDATAFADSGQTVRVDVHPRPGVYGIDFTTTAAFRPSSASVEFDYPVFFSAPARARQVYGSDVAYERALAIGRILPDNQLELLPSSRPAADNLEATLSAAGNYLVAAPQ